MKRILVVDDHRSVAEALRALLEADGYEVTALESGQDALTALARDHYDAVVTDVEMPGVRGDEVVAAAIRADPAMTVLVVTACEGSVGCRRAVALGAHRVFAKPLAVEALEAELASRFGLTGT